LRQLAHPPAGVIAGMTKLDSRFARLGLKIHLLLRGQGGMTIKGFIYAKDAG
jgi:hypothetical protein